VCRAQGPAVVPPGRCDRPGGCRVDQREHQREHRGDHRGVPRQPRDRQRHVRRVPRHDDVVESIHSLADTGNQGPLLLGGWRSRHAASEQHPFDDGRERYSWSFVVAVVLFTLGAVLG
jgi:hypothetical protein